jgi:uracil-DNA glycosylase family 4
MAKRRGCTSCPLYETANTVKISGERLCGSGPVDILFVGQNPEEDDDETTRLGAGPASRLLLDLVKETGMGKISIWHTTAVKCLPPNESKPKKIHTDACLRHLKQEIEKLSPKVLVASGDTALRSLTGKSGISKLIGLSLPTEYGIPCIPVFHPNYVLNRPGALGKQLSLFKTVKRSIDNVDHDPTKETDVKIVSSARDVRALFNKRFKRMTAFDYETGGFDPGYEALNPQRGFIRSISLTDEVGKAWVIPLNEPGMKCHHRTWSMVGEWLASKRSKVAHGSSFESIWSRHNFGQWPVITDDTRCMYHLLDENSVNNLSDLTGEHLPDMAGYDAEMDTFLSAFKNRGEGYTKAPFDMLAHYNGQDSDATLRLLRLFKPRLIADVQLFSLYTNITMPSTTVMAKFQHRGMAVDPLKLAQAVTAMIDKKDRVKAELESMAPVKQTMKRLKRDDFNPGSPKQVGELLYKTMNLKTDVKTKTGSSSTSEAALLKLPQDNRVVQLLTEVSSVKGLLNTLTGYQHHTVKYGKRWYIKASYDNSFVVTGRVSCREPNLMAIPRPDDSLKCGVAESFGSRYKDGRLVYADYSQIELRLLAEMTEEPTWYNGFFDPKFDPHQTTADHNKTSRFEAKKTNFGVVYGIGAAKLASQLNCSYLVARDMLDSFWRIYPCIKDWFDDQHLEVRSKGEVRTKLGRVRRLPDGRDLPDNDPAQWRAARQGPNFKIQGFAADVVATAMILIEERIRGYRSKLVNQMHDALITDCPPDEIKRTNKIMRDVMVHEVPKMYGIRVPLVVDLKVLRSLGEAG